jgi:hypothetical protein
VTAGTDTPAFAVVKRKLRKGRETVKGASRLGCRERKKRPGLRFHLRDPLK